MDLYLIIRPVSGHLPLLKSVLLQEEINLCGRMPGLDGATARVAWVHAMPMQLDLVTSRYEKAVRTQPSRRSDLVVLLRTLGVAYYALLCAGGWFLQTVQ